MSPQAAWIGLIGSASFDDQHLTWLPGRFPALVLWQAVAGPAFWRPNLSRWRRWAPSLSPTTGNEELRTPGNRVAMVDDGKHGEKWEGVNRVLRVREGGRDSMANDLGPSTQGAN